MDYKTEYLTTPHWRQFKEKHIYSNPRAECFICQKPRTLLPHHFSYKKLYQERVMTVFLFLIFGDIVIVCFDCHTSIHFIPIRVLFIKFKIRVPLKRELLLARMFYLRYKDCIRKKQYIRLLQSNLF